MNISDHLHDEHVLYSSLYAVMSPIPHTVQSDVAILTHRSLDRVVIIIEEQDRV